MKTKLAILCLLTIALCPPTHAQGTAFTYQGRLNDSANPANGIYDLRFTIYATSSGGSALAGPLTNAATGLSNGLFTVTLDFGAAVFTGAERWLEIGVRSNGIGAFSTLAPRQQIAAAPYAVFARGANASGLTGTLPSSGLFGTYSGPLSFNNGANSFNGSFYGQFFGTSFTGGSFSGDGSGLLNLNASQITEGDFPASSLENAWRIIGNSGTTDTNFIGTIDNQPLNFRVGNVRGFRIEPDPRGSEAPNIVGGHTSNRIEQPGSGGSVVVGGGFIGGPNIVRSNSSGVFIGAGSANEVGPNINDAVIAGGFANAVRTYGAAIGGGSYNLIQTNSDNAAIGGGYGNVLQSGSGYSTIAGGAQNEIQGNAGFSAVGGGWLNKIQVTADQSVIAGGNANEIFPGARESFIGGGFANQVRSNAYNAVIGGGAYNVITNAGVATIGGGTGNTNRGYAATVAGGFYNTAIGNGATVGGGGLNVAAGFNTTVAGGDSNQALAQNAAVGGGFHNTNSGSGATIAGGYENQATTTYATVPGGFQNRAAGNYSFAAGRQAKANHPGTFVWADSTAADFPSVMNNEFAVRASGGVRFATPGMTLNGQPVLTADSTNALSLNNPANSIVGTFSGDGAGLTNLNAWRLNGNAGTTPGAHFLGTTDNQPLEFKVNGSRAMRLEPADAFSALVNVIGGSLSNQVINGARGATIAGGGYEFPGDANIVGGDLGTIGGGRGNLVSVAESVVAGGRANTASAFNATVSGGFANTASGDYATVPGGQENTAVAAYALAAGRQAKANHAGTFVWADNQAVDFVSSGINQLLIRATGGVGINTNNPGTAALAVNGNITTTGGLSFTDQTKSVTFPAVAGATAPMINMFASGTGNSTRMVFAHSPAFPSYGLQYIDATDQFEFLGAGSSIMNIGLGSGNVGIGTNNPTNRLHVIGGATFSSGAAGANQNVVWTPGSASWSFTSDRSAKDRITPVDTESVLQKLARIPISEWSYIGYDQRHIGPMAQDFHAQFPLNPNDKALNDADLHGVALAAIQGLNQKVQEKNAEIQSLKSELEQLKKVVNKLANAKE